MVVHQDHLEALVNVEKGVREAELARVEDLVHLEHQGILAKMAFLGLLGLMVHLVSLDPEVTKGTRVKLEALVMKFSTKNR